MKRLITQDLLKWKASDRRKPLVLRGARQVGKTYIVKDFGENYYDSCAYFNFDQDTRLTSLFAETKDPQRLIEQLSLVSGQKIEPGKTLIFFDEIQECEAALNTLKYFKEFMPEHHVIAAGSLLGIKLSHSSFPVGMVNYLDLAPMNFAEFLMADGLENLAEYVLGVGATAHAQAEKTPETDAAEHVPLEKVPEIIATRLTEKLKTYFLIGGMPEVVQSWVTNKDINEVHQIQDEILRAYEDDFAKHTTASEANKISLIWHSLPSQLARENKKFVYQAIRDSARAREYESALNWLRDANMVYKVPCVTAPKLPLSAYEDLTAFKIYLLDVGLLSYMSGIDAQTILDGNDFFSEFKGALTENYVLQEIAKGRQPSVFYYDFDRYSLDFIAQHDGRIYPIEVKSAERASHVSITKYIEKYQPELGVRFSPNNLTHDGKILNIPLYLAGEWKRFLA